MSKIAMGNWQMSKFEMKRSGIPMRETKSGMRK